MSGFSRISTSPAAAYGSLLLTSIRNFHYAFLSGSRTFKALGIASLSDSRTVCSSTPVSSIVNSPRVETPSPRHDSRGAVERGEWGSQICSWPRLLPQPSFELCSRGFSCSYSTSVIAGSLFQWRHFASSTIHEAKPPRRKPQEGKTNPRIKPELKSRKGGVVARKGRPPFRGALASIKDLESEQVGGKSQSSSVRGDVRKQQKASSARPLRRTGRVIRSPMGKNSSLSSGFKSKNRPADHGLKLKRKRKRIKPRPGDITYKRGLDVNVMNVAIDTGQRPAAQEKESSLNARFRQIQPSVELLAHIEQNFLGRRRLAEWRRGGYDPKRTAPLDDLLEGKTTKKNPIQETVFKHKLTFVAAAKQAPSLPPLDYPEVAFAGRSNVGKSSLINALTRRWGAARTSDKPGLTQSINFFTLGSQLCLVDLPGYGFAYAKEGKKEEWEELVKGYVQTRANLKRVCVLVDAKWGLKPRDEELLHLMECAGTRYQVVVTKTDVLPPLDLARRATQILQGLEDHRCLIRPLMMVSSKTGAGMQNFRASLARIAVSQSRVLREDNL